MFGLANRSDALGHAMQYARGLTEADADKFVGMYVNDYTVDYGDKGREAVHELLARAAKLDLIPSDVPVEFVDDSALI